MDPEDTLVDIIEEVYDRAILKTGRNTFNMAKYLEENKFKKSDVTRFVESGTAGNISCTIDDLDHQLGLRLLLLLGSITSMPLFSSYSFRCFCFFVVPRIT